MINHQLSMSRICKSLSWLCALALLANPLVAQPKYVGVKQCAQCHSNENNLNDWLTLVVTDVWKNDAHSRSHLALSSSNEITKRIEDALHIKAKDNQNCVACHTKATGEPAVPADEALLTRGLIHDGISCETCHGPGSEYLLPHQNDPQWRFKSSDEKAKLGMVDLRNPRLKADNCLSCHLGNVDQHKVVTHEMYAAGHPPLTGFEMETFGHAMPSHWKRVWEKPEVIQKAAKKANYQTELDSETQRALVGNLMALRGTVGLLKDQAGANPLKWPELSHYDCQACHHDLRIPSWRQERGYGGLIPGRPAPHLWPRQVAVTGLPSGTTVSTLVDPLTSALNRKPFGDPVEIAKPAVATKVVENIDNQLQVIGAPGWYNKNREMILRQLGEAGNQPNDFDSTRQLVWISLLACKDNKIFPEDRLARITELFDKQLATSVSPTQADAKDAFWLRSLEKQRTFDPTVVHEALTGLGSRFRSVRPAE